MNYTTSVRHGSTLSQTPSFESLKSTSTSNHITGYSHPLYSASSTSKDNITLNTLELALEESRFSSCSSSPASSCESLGSFTTSRNWPTRSSATPSALSAAFSSSSSTRSSRSTSYSSSRFADDHYPLITSILQHEKCVLAPIMDMAHAYNTYIRAINSCFNHAMYVNAEDIRDFMFFNQTLFNILSQHLQIEAQYLQPLLHRPVPDQKLALRKTVLICDDQVFLASFQAWANYVHSQTSLHSYSGDELQAHINGFAPRLIQHLHDEVAYLNDLVTETILMPEHLSKIWSKFDETFSNNLDLYTDAALLVGCHDRHFTINGQKSEQNFPKLSKGSTTMVKRWHSRRHDSAWKYCSSDFSGKRRGLSI